MKRVAQAEKRLHGAADDADAALVAAGLQCRSCPRCGTRIEKNAGCDEMECYLCGHHFTWQKAKKVKVVRAVENASDGSNDTARVRTRVTGTSIGARNAARRAARNAARQAASESNDRTALTSSDRQPPQWVIEQLPSPPMTAPSFVPRDVAKTATIDRLARPRHCPTFTPTSSNSERTGGRAS